MTTAHQQAKTIASFTASQPLSRPQTSEAQDQRNQQIITLLAKLASHCPPRDGTVEQQKHRALDFLDDLNSYTVAEIDNACGEYRRNPKNRFFPTPGGLIEILEGNKKFARELGSGRPAAFEFGDSRPLKWWMQAKARWQPHWSEEQVPEGELIRDHPGDKLRQPNR